MKHCFLDGKLTKRKYRRSAMRQIAWPIFHCNFFMMEYGTPVLNCRKFKPKLQNYKILLSFSIRALLHTIGHRGWKCYHLRIVRTWSKYHTNRTGYTLGVLKEHYFRAVKVFSLLVPCFSGDGIISVSIESSICFTLTFSFLEPSVLWAVRGIWPFLQKWRGFFISCSWGASWALS